MEDRIRETASDWFARMRGPDAVRLRPEFEQWLAASSDHLRTYRRLELRWAQADLVRHTPTGAARATAEAASARSRTWGRYAAAASIALVFLLSLVLLMPVRPGTDPAATQASRIETATAIRRVALADGSRVTLDAATALEVRLASGERRIVLLRGRARFEVAHDPDRPFTVVAGDREIVATGTIFDVNLTPEGASVALLRGGVEVRSTAPSGRRTLAHLTPGQALAARSVTLRPLPAVATEWPSGMAAFERARLGEVVALANRYASRRITLSDPALAELRITGAFRMGDPDKLTASLAAALDLEAQGTAGGDLVLTRPR
nr:FecR domain-containing protein [uncultured Sphingomonas sp.]